jgi:hypothetical protein
MFSSYISPLILESPPLFELHLVQVLLQDYCGFWAANPNINHWADEYSRVTCIIEVGITSRIHDLEFLPISTLFLLKLLCFSRNSLDCCTTSSHLFPEIMMISHIFCYIKTTNKPAWSYEKLDHFLLFFSNSPESTYLSTTQRIFVYPLELLYQIEIIFHNFSRAWLCWSPMSRFQFKKKKHGKGWLSWGD